VRYGQPVANRPVFHTNQSPIDIARALDRDGFVCLDNVVSDEWLKLARDEVTTLSDHRSESIFSIVGVGDNDGTFAALVHDPSVQRLLRELVDIAWPSRKGDSEENFYSVLNVTRGSSSPGAGFHLHYDAHVVALLIPLFMPTYAGLGTSGELAVLSNRRPFRRSAIVDLFEKFAVQNFLSNRRILRRLRRGSSEELKPLEVGNAYLFWGYRTLHGAMPTPAGEVRSTLLIHLGNPHGDQWMLGLAKRLRKLLVSNDEVPSLSPAGR
jgi:hypothetical protein